MSRLLPRFFKRLTISACLRGAFLTGALLTLTVSGVSLYSWHEQSSQVRYALDDYFPRIQSSFVIESNLNTLVDQLNEFLQAANTNARLQLRNQIVGHLEQIEQASMQLDNPERQQIQATLAESRQLLGRLDNALYNMFIAREKVNEIAARISWLHDDFTTELNSLVQDFSWQQGALLESDGDRLWQGAPPLAGQFARGTERAAAGLCPRTHREPDRRCPARSPQRAAIRR